MVTASVNDPLVANLQKIKLDVFLTKMEKIFCWHCFCEETGKAASEREKKGKMERFWSNAQMLRPVGRKRPKIAGTNKT